MTVTNPPATTTPAAFKTWATQVATDVNANTTGIAGILDGFTATGEIAAPSLKASGKTGATTSPAILAGGTNTGNAPASGAHVVGELVVGHDGTLYVCTVAGTPGTWVEATGGGGAGEIGPETDLNGPTVIPAMIVVSDTGMFIGLSTDPADIQAFTVPVLAFNTGGLWVQSDAAGNNWLDLHDESAQIGVGDGVDGSFIGLQTGGVSVQGNEISLDTPVLKLRSGAAGIDGADTVADATDNASAILRLNEALAVLRAAGILT